MKHSRYRSLTKAKIMKISEKFLIYAALIFAVIVTFFPMAWMVVTSIRTRQELFTIPVIWIPKHPTIENYITLFGGGGGVAGGRGETKFLNYFSNSLIVASSTTLITLPIASFAAYGFSRFRIKGRNAFIYLFLTTQMFPTVLIMISMYMLMRDLNLIDTYQCLVILYTTFALPFSTLMMKSFFDGLPVDLEEAAMVDGCSRVGALLRITLPLVAPGLIATGIFSFILAWDEFLYALTFTSSDAMRTITIGIKQFQEEFVYRWELIMAASVAMTIPVILIFAFVQKHLIRGLTAGAVKG